MLETAELFWISPTRSDGRPHVTPPLRFGSMTPPLLHRRHRAEGGQPSRNSHVILTTGFNHWDKGIVWRDLRFSSNPNSWKSNGGLLRQLNFGALSDTNFISAIVRL